MTKIKLQDESGDKKYFTQLPNIVLNHSTANDQALYCQMKRYAGENGKCFATQETLMKKLSIGRLAFNKSLNYLLKRGWIKFEGLTNGKTRPIKTYSVVDIWKQNIMEYEKIPSETTISLKQEIPSETTRDTVQNSSKIPSETAIEEEHNINNNQEEEIAIQRIAFKKEIDRFIDLFKNVNPSYKTFFSNKTERACLERLLKEHGRERITEIIEILPKTNLMEFAPVITSPFKLEKKLGDLLAFVEKQKVKMNSKKIITL